MITNRILYRIQLKHILMMKENRKIWRAYYIVLQGDLQTMSLSLFDKHSKHP